MNWRARRRRNGRALALRRGWAWKANSLWKATAWCARLRGCETWAWKYRGRSVSGAWRLINQLSPTIFAFSGHHHGRRPVHARLSPRCALRRPRRRPRPRCSLCLPCQAFVAAVLVPKLVPQVRHISPRRLKRYQGHP